MNRQTFISVLTAAAAAIGVLQAGVVNLPIDDAYKSFIVLAVSVVSTFIAGLVHTPSN